MAVSLDTLKQDAATLLKEMVEIPSVSYHEKEVSDHIASRLESWGIGIQRIDNNIICRCKGYDRSKPTLLLEAHIDTVAPTPEYDFDPYTPYQPSMPGAICGLGSNDDGGSVVSMMAAFRYFEGRELPFNLMLTLSAEEECTGENGICRTWDEVLSKEVTWAIIGEPTQMRAATSERGLIVIDGEARGVSGHAAREEGVNALYIAMDDIARLRSHKFAGHSQLMGEVHLNVTQINAGTVHNVVPDLCTFVVDIRPTDVYDNAQLVAELQAECQSTLKPRNLRNASSATPSGSPVALCLSACGIETFSSPTTSDWIRIKCPAVKMGPGNSNRSHKKNEYLLESELYEAVDTYIRFIENYGNTLE